MKLNFYKLYFLTFFLLIDFVAFADDVPGSDDGTDDGLEGPDPAPAPINGKLLWLAVVGILFAFYAYKRTRKTA